VSCPVNRFKKVRGNFCSWKGATTNSGGPHGRRSNAFRDKKALQILEGIHGTGH